MSEALISVIVPVYNVQKYLDGCMETILNQTWRNLEIILVDDGSTDESGAMCDTYAAQDARVRVLHKNNGGLSSARNLGIDTAAGDYIMLIDSDDTVDTHMAERLMGLIDRYDADIAACELMLVYSDGSTFQKPLKDDYVCTGREAVAHSMKSQDIYAYAVNKLYRKEVWRDFRFESGRYYEDTEVIPFVLYAAAKVAVCSDPMYHYYQRANSITNASFHKKQMDIIWAYERQMEYFGERCPELIDAINYRLDWARFDVLDKMIVADYPRTEPEYRDAVRWIRKHAMRILKCPYLRKTRKICAILICISDRLYARAVKLYARKRMI